MKDPMQRFTIAVTGDFGHQRTHEKMRQWVEKNGGTWSKDVTENVTHLICSKEHFRKKASMVRQAMRMKYLHVVSFDWLEDSLMKQRPLKVGAYLMDRRVESRAKQKAAKKENIKKGMKVFEQNCQEFREVMHSDGHHIYRDHTGFAYDITLCRANLLTNQNEAYHLKLYETHTVPKSFACYVKYSGPEESDTQILAPVASSFGTAYSAFKKFFALRTRKEWHLRADGKAAEGSENDGTGPFRYIPPPQDEPLGVVECEEPHDVVVDREWADVLAFLSCGKTEAKLT